MGSSRIVTLLSDFGCQDVYVAVMKGTIAKINPNPLVIDLTHDIPPQDIAAGAFQLANAVPYFPNNTVHVAVVDPGVGGERRAVAVHCSCGYLVGPDNGLFGRVCDRYPPIAAVELNVPRFWRVESPSTTFHGRDIFAPVGAHLASGVPLSQVGTPIDPQSLVTGSNAPPEQRGQEWVGSIQACDRFGNLITNIPGNTVKNTAWLAIANRQSIPSGKTYSDVGVGKAIALIGSHGWVELAVNGGNASEQLQLSCDDRVEIQLLGER